MVRATAARRNFTTPFRPRPTVRRTSARTRTAAGRLLRALAVLAVLVGQLTWLSDTAAATERMVVVVLKNGADPARVAANLGIDVKYVYRYVFSGFAGTLPANAARDLIRHPDVAAADDATPIQIAAQTNPANIERVGAARPAGPAGRSTVDVDIAVLDTGIDLDHPDLDVAGGTDCTGSGSYDDDHGHGTHVAGIIGAKDNALGVVGVAPGARLYAVKVLDATNSYSSTAQLICGLDWVVANAETIDVVNMSLGGLGIDGDCYSSAFHLAICRTAARSIPIVASAMNFGADASRYVPATFEEVITVSAFNDFDGKPGGHGSPNCLTLEDDDTFAGFQQLRADVDVAAPGRCIRSTTRGGDTGLMTGTSMATPHVTGAIALYMSEFPDATVSEVRTWLLNAATKPQDSSGGFAGDPDDFAEPVLDLGFSPGRSGNSLLDRVADFTSGRDPDAGAPATKPAAELVDVPVSGLGTGATALDPKLKVYDHGQSYNAVDGRGAYDANLATGWGTRSDSPASATIWFDLGADQQITAIRWQFNRLGFADHWRIRVSDDFDSWQSLATRRNADDVDTWETLDTDVTARYVRFEFTNPNGDTRIGFLSEVEFRGIARRVSPTSDSTSDTSEGDNSSSEERAPRITGQATVAARNGHDAVCRAEPSEDARIITRFEDGETVDLLGKPSSGWQSIGCNSRVGYVPLDVLEVDSDEADTSSESQTTSDDERNDGRSDRHRSEQASDEKTDNSKSNGDEDTRRRDRDKSKDDKDDKDKGKKDRDKKDSNRDEDDGDTKKTDAKKKKS